MTFKVITEELSDDSIVYNVTGKVEEQTVVFACSSYFPAVDLAALLNEQVAWITITNSHRKAVEAGL